MHESSLMRSLLSQVNAIRVENGGEHVHEIRIEVGPLSGVEPLLLQSAFETLSAEYGMIRTQLKIDEVELTGRCPACGVVPVSLRRFACPACDSPKIVIIGGDSILLKSIVIQSASAQETPV